MAKKKVSDFDKAVLACHRAVLTDSMLAIDPSSGGGRGKSRSKIGYAWYESGKLVESGTISLPEDRRHCRRLRNVYDTLIKKFPTTPKVLAIEELKWKNVPYILQRAVGCIMVCIRSPLVIEVPVKIWKQYRTATYKKTDQQDAKLIGVAVIRKSKEIS